jgi:hypothetical protein
VEKVSLSDFVKTETPIQVLVKHFEHLFQLFFQFALPQRMYNERFSGFSEPAGSLELLQICQGFDSEIMAFEGAQGIEAGDPTVLEELFCSGPVLGLG